MAIKLIQQDTGSTVYQVTEDSLSKSNIYCEIPYCSADSRYFVYSRANPEHDRNRAEYVVCELGTWEMHMGGRGTGGVAITHSGVFYCPGNYKITARRHDLGQRDKGTRRQWEFPRP